MTEYVIIVALVAIAAIGVVGIFGDDVRAMLGTSVDALAGEAHTSTGAQTADGSADHRDVTNFSQQAGGHSDDPDPRPPPRGQR